MLASRMERRRLLGLADAVRLLREMSALEDLIGEPLVEGSWQHSLSLGDVALAYLQAQKDDASSDVLAALKEIGNHIVGYERDQHKFWSGLLAEGSQ